MQLKTAFTFALGAAVLTAGVARAADVSADVQKTLTADYQLNCAAALDPSDKNFDAATALLAPDFVAIDAKGKQFTRDQVVAQGKQQMKIMHATTCTNDFSTWTQVDPNTLTVVNTTHMDGDVQTPDGKHEFNLMSKTQDTWKLVSGAWLQAQTKDLHVVVKIDGSVAQDEGGD